MPKLPRLSGAEMVHFLQAQDFAIVRVGGSHYVLARGDARTTVPVHGSRTLRVGTLRGILRDIEMSPAEFARLYKG